MTGRSERDFVRLGNRHRLQQFLHFPQAADGHDQPVDPDRIIVRARVRIPDDPEEFYRMVFADAVTIRSGQFYGQITNEREWELARRPNIAQEG